MLKQIGSAQRNPWWEGNGPSGVGRDKGVRNGRIKFVSGTLSDEGRWAVVVAEGV